MAQAEFEVGGRRYALACREGEQARIEALAGIVDTKARQATQGLGGVNEARHLLLAALLLADELKDARAGVALPPASAPDPALAPALAALAERLEALAARLEKDGAPA
jgi:cell division protein ZapA